MLAVPFQDLRPARSGEHAQWVVDALLDKEGVALVVPNRFDAYGRVLHPLATGARWASVATEYLQPGGADYPYPFPAAVQPVEGDMGSVLVDTLVPLLAEWTTTAHDCHFGLWDGWGDLHPGSRAVAYARRGPRRRNGITPFIDKTSVYEVVHACPLAHTWGGRSMLLFDGPIEAVRAIGSPRRGPQWWWPRDRRWFVATEIDDPWTYLAGPAGLVDTVIADLGLEAVRVEPTDRW